MKYGWLVIAVFAARFLATAIVYPAGDGDLAWQRWLGATIARTGAIPRSLGGETFSAPGAPWLPQEWAFSLLAHLARSGIAWDMFAGMVALCAVAALGIAGLQAQARGASPRTLALLIAFAGFALFESFGVRAQVLAWPLIAAYLWLLEIEGPWAFAALGVAALWSNLHASAMLAPVLAGLFTIGSALDERGIGKRTQRLALIAVGSVAAICCNPFGWHLPAYAIGLFASPIKTYITEWKVTDIDDLSFAFGALPLLLIGMLAGARDKGRRGRDGFVLIGFAFLVLSAARNVPIFAIAALPIVAPAFSRAFGWFAAAPPKPLLRSDRLAAFALPVSALALAAIVAVQLVRTAPPPANLANAPLEALADVPGEHRLFCADFAWCGLTVGAPNVRVFLDGRADPYPIAVWRDFASVVRLDGLWRVTLDRRGVDAVLVAKDSALDQALSAGRGWRVNYADKTYRLWLRVAAPSQQRFLSAREARLDPPRRIIRRT